MIKRIIFSTIVLTACVFFASLLYKTICIFMLWLVWRKRLMNKVPDRYRRWCTRAVWLCFVVIVWTALPRWRIDCGDRVRLVYVDNDGNAKHPPVSQYLVNAVVPESEIMNLGITGVIVSSPIIQKLGLSQALIKQTQNDIFNGRILNFYSPYKNLGMCNPMAGVYPQLFNDTFGTDYRAVYISNPKHFDESRSYPLVVFCHGYLGNWQLYQGIWKDLENAIVLSIGTHGMEGLFTGNDINSIFTFYIPMLEKMGYKIDASQLHLIGLSNGGSAVSAAMQSRHISRFKSITAISCTLRGLRHVPCKVNIIGGGKDHLSTTMPSQCRQLKRMGVDAEMFFKDDDNHYVLVNQREEILEFLKTRMCI